MTSPWYIGVDIGGTKMDVSRCESLLRTSIEDSISKEAMAETCKACEMVPAELGESIGDYGAATVAALGIENALKKTT
jgi:predicted NBD/HSP70 family sugar kinase